MSGSGSAYGDGFYEEPSCHNGTPTDIYDDNESKKSHPATENLQKSSSSISKPFALSKAGMNMSSQDQNSKPLRYFVNTYDNLPARGPIFEIKKVSRKKNPVLESQTPSKQIKPSSTPEESVSKPTDPEALQKKAFKITKKSAKKENSSVKVPASSKNGQKEGKKKLAADLVPSPNTSPTDSSPIAQKMSLKKIKEDQKVRETPNPSKKSGQSASGEPSKKIAEDDFSQFLFNGKDRKKRTRGPKKVTRNIRDPAVKASERV